jgi:hypothetical protein
MGVDGGQCIITGVLSVNGRVRGVEAVFGVRVGEEWKRCLEFG